MALPRGAFSSLANILNPTSSRNFSKLGKSLSKPVNANYEESSINRLTPEQEEIFSQLMGGSKEGLSSSLDYLNRLAQGDESLFKELEAPAMRQFGEFQGQLASRFSGSGLGGRHGSGFQKAAGAGAQQFAENLASQRQNLRQGAIADLLGLNKELMGLSKQESFLMEPKRKKYENLLAALLPLIGGAVGASYGGPMGALAGSQIGGAASSQLF